MTARNVIVNEGDLGEVVCSVEYARGIAAMIKSGLSDQGRANAGDAMDAAAGLQEYLRAISDRIDEIGAFEEEKPKAAPAPAPVVANKTAKRKRGAK